MIIRAESWGRKLKRYATKLARFSKGMQIDEPHFIEVEEIAFLGFYVIRKLYESGKISKEIYKKPIPVAIFSKKVNEAYIRESGVEEIYDYSSFREGELEVGKLCNQIIHSHIFTLQIGLESCLDGIYVVSDREKNQCLYLIPIEAIVELLLIISKDILA